MRYILFQAGYKLWRHAAVYLFMAAQIAMGVAVIVCSVNYTRSIDAHMVYIGGQSSAFSHILRPEGFGNRPLSDLLILPEDFEILADELQGKATMGYVSFAKFLETGDNQFAEIILVFASDEFAKAYLGQEIPQGAALAGSTVLETTVYENRSNLNRITFDQRGLTLHNGLRYEYEPLGSTVHDAFLYMVAGNLSLKMKDCVFLSVSEFANFVDTNPSLVDCMLRYTPVNPDDSSSVAEINAILSAYLQQREEKALGVKLFSDRYSAIDLSEQYLSIAKFQGRALHDLTMVANVGMAIVVLGLTGVLTVFITRRRAELTIRQMLGATRWSLFWALFCEVGCVCLVGGMLGLLGAIPITRTLIKSYLAPITYHAEAAIPMIAGYVLFMAFIPSLIAFVFVRSQRPTETLKSL